MTDLDKAITSAVKTGKVSFGANSALKNAKTGKSKLIVLAANCPKSLKEEIEYYCDLSDVPIMVYKGASLDLAALCNRPYAVSALSIRELGDSEILKVENKMATETKAGGNE